MTIVNNSNHTLYSCYHIEGENDQREDIDKVTELAYHPFESNKEMEKEPDFDQICCLEKFQKNLLRIREIYDYDTEVLNSLDSVENLQKDLSDLIHKNRSLPKEKLFSLVQEKVKKEVLEYEITESAKRTVPLIIDEILLNRNALRTWTQEVDRWRNIPIDNWPPEFTNQKALFLMNGKATICPMKTFQELCQRKDYKEAIAFKTNLPIVNNVTEFEKRLQILEQRYSYDEEMVAAITKAKELRQNLSETFQRNSNFPQELLPAYIISAIAGEVKDSSKTSLIISILKAVLLEREAIRTQSEEVNRWKKVPIEKWPSQIRDNGVYFLDNDNKATYCSPSDFEKLITNQLTKDKIKSITYGVLLSSVVMGTGLYFYSKR